MNHEAITPVESNGREEDNSLENKKAQVAALQAEIAALEDQERMLETSEVVDEGNTVNESMASQEELQVLQEAHDASDAEKLDKVRDEMGLEGLRRGHEADFEEQAAARNKNRSAVKKVFGMGKATSMDFAHEEASRMNEVIDETVARSEDGQSVQEVADTISESAEFAEKEKIRFKSIEKINAQNPEIAQNIHRGDFAAAQEGFASLTENAPFDEKQQMSRGLQKMIADQVDTFVKSGNNEALVEMIEKSDIRQDIGVDNLKLLPPELLQNEKVQSALKSEIHSVFRHDRVRGLKKAFDYATQGMMTMDAVRELMRSSEYQDTLKRDINSKYRNAPKAGFNLARSYVDNGLMDVDDAQAVMDGLVQDKAA